jgi:cytochrome c2
MGTLAGDDSRETRISMEVSTPSHALRRRLAYRRGLAVIGLAAAAFLLGCAGGQQVEPYTVATGGSVHSGRRVIADYKCGSCHTIPGISGAHGVFGPPLSMLARRTYIAGNFANTPANLTHWVMAPTSMKPKTAMPDLGLTRQQARDVTAFLETLR